MLLFRGGDQQHMVGRMTYHSVLCADRFFDRQMNGMRSACTAHHLAAFIRHDQRIVVAALIGNSPSCLVFRTIKPAFHGKYKIMNLRRMLIDNPCITVAQFRCIENKMVRRCK